MPLIKDGRIVNDKWQTLAEGAAFPTEGAVIVGLDRWQADADTLKASGLSLGVVLNSHQSPEELEDELDVLELVALNFPSFTDGRAFTYGRMLRERYSFEGEIRAVGGFILDQLAMLRRCGFDAFETSSEALVKAVQRDSHVEVTVYYQPSQDSDDETVSSLRRRLLESHNELGDKIS